MFLLIDGGGKARENDGTNSVIDDASQNTKVAPLSMRLKQIEYQFRNEAARSGRGLDRKYMYARVARINLTAGIFNGAAE
jgi:hypothetical protein